MFITGTVIEGSVKIGEEIEFPEIGQKKKVKSIQMFKKSIDKGHQGDRIGILLSQLDHNLVLLLILFILLLSL